jgi:hypothetical protein
MASIKVVSRSNSLGKKSEQRRQRYTTFAQKRAKQMRADRKAQLIAGIAAREHSPGLPAFKTVRASERRR